MFISLNVFIIPIFKYKVNSNTDLAVFHGMFMTKAISKPNYVKPKINPIKSKYRISFQRPPIWGTFIVAAENKIESFPFFESKVKTKLLDNNDIIDFFWVNAIWNWHVP